jgi:iron complex transport system ATP-binding protein
MKIHAEKLTVRFGDATILNSVGLLLNAGEMVGLIGPNGAGKTTLLRVLADLLPASNGEVRYDGKSRREIGRLMLARWLSFLAQGGDAYWPLRVDHIVALGRLPHRLPFAGMSAEDYGAVERAIAAADIAHLRLRTAGTLSGGELMRVLLARALAVEAEMLLADEPVAALDPLHQLRIMQLLRATAQKGAGVVVVLHDLTLASRFCDRIVLLAGGRILLDGAPAERSDDLIAEAYRVAAFRGDYGGQPFVLPWAPLQPRSPADMTIGVSP